MLVRAIGRLGAAGGLMHSVARMVFAAAALSVLALSPTPARGEQVTLRVDWLLRSYHAPFFLGIEKGWYEEAGIQLKVNEGRGSGNVVQLVGGGHDMFGFVSGDAVVRGVQSGAPIQSVANIMPVNADAIFVLRKSGLTRPQDLKGRTIATTPGGTSDTLLPAFLRESGLEVGDVTIVSVDSTAKAQLLLQGRVDAMNSTVWATGMFDAAGGVTSFLYADYGVQVVGYGIIANTDAIRAKPDLIRRFVAVTMRAWAHALRRPDEALAALEKNSAEIAKPDMRERNRRDLQEALKLVGPAVPGKPFGYQDVAKWEAMQRQLLEYRAIREVRPSGQYVTNQFVE